MGGDKLCSLYFSIAESYKDCGEYEKALEYYGKEMELYHNAPDEVSGLEIGKELELMWKYL